MQAQIINNIRQQYFHPRADRTGLFETILAAASQVDLEDALAVLEQCVLEKRSAWLSTNLPAFQTTADPIQDAYRLFYETYLHLSIPGDGEIVARTGRSLVLRWWNPCLTLEACQRFGLDTCQVCRLAYHQPVQIFLTPIHPALRFDRNYACLRPHTSYCEEMILLEG